MTSTPPTPLSAAAPATSFGEVGPDGTVFLRLPDGSQREVGQWAAGDTQAGLEFFARKYYDVITEIDIAAKRLADDRSTPEETEVIVERIRKSVLEPTYVGDMAALVARIGQLEVLINVKKEALNQAKEEQRKAALEKRDQLAAEAESLASSTSWKATTERFTAIVDEWKVIPRSDRAKENELWKRISASRTAFDKARRQHYAELDAARTEAKAKKDALVKKAQELSSSTDWQKTTNEYRNLLDQWKKAGRAGKADDKLWDQFKAAQDVFFSARNGAFAERSEDEKKALEAKEALLAEAEALLPVKNIGASKRALSDIHDKWEKAGRVPRNDVRRIEARLKKVEDAIRDADSAKWANKNTEVQTRASETVLRFREAVEKRARALQRAQEGGVANAIAKAQAELDSAKAMLAVAEQSSQKLK